MRVGRYDVKSPLILGGEESEAEVLGASVWLWMHSPLHRDAPLHALPTLLLPVIKRQQYVVVAEQGFSQLGLAEPGVGNALSHAACHSYAAGGLEQRRPDVVL